MEELLALLITFLTLHWVRLTSTVVLIILWVIFRNNISTVLHFSKQKHAFAEHRYLYVKKIALVALNLTMTIILVVLWDISFSGLTVYFASFFTLVGVAFFAQWSMISNVTASLILFLYFPYKIGDYVTIEGENITGKIKDISFFTTELENKEQETISYPNNLLIQKPVRIHKVNPFLADE